MIIIRNIKAIINSNGDDKFGFDFKLSQGLNICM